ncbi:MAG: hypothetical protein ACRYGK_15275 [Janthinobacterium lividum]
MDASDAAFFAAILSPACFPAWTKRKHFPRTHRFSVSWDAPAPPQWKPMRNLYDGNNSMRDYKGQHKKIPYGDAAVLHEVLARLP